MSKAPKEKPGEPGGLVLERTKTKRPGFYSVLLHNDDYTTMDFVVEVLRRFFHKSEVEAMAIMLQVHKQGMGLAGIYTRDVAETKCYLTMEYATKKGHPLKCTVERQQ